jgi:putative MATE family efflux protein
MPDAARVPDPAGVPAAAVAPTAGAAGAHALDPAATAHEAGARNTPLPDAASARFVTGSTLRHVVVMAATGSVGLMAVFLVDLLSLLYVARLGDPRLTAAVGFASILQFFVLSIGIGLMIAVGAMVSKALGAGDRSGARRVAGSALALGALACAVLVAAVLPLLDPLLAGLGADAGTAALARHYLWIVLPSNVPMTVGMGFSGLLRAVGDARRAMVVTLAGAVATAILDPVLIFGLDLGLTGAAVTVEVARLVMLAVGFHAAVVVHGLVARPTRRDAQGDARAVLAIAGPAILTSLAPAAASAVLARVLAPYGPAVIAGNAVIDRLTPVAFGGLFAMSGAIGPILGQNWGARRFDRMRATLRDAALCTAGYTAATWAVLALVQAPLARFFGLEGEAAGLFAFFCHVGGAIWFFNGLLFLANAAFNNLGFPLASTGFNWGRATLGTIPFAVLGAWLAGPQGALAGTGVGSLVFGTAAIRVAWRTVDALEHRP